MIMACLAAITIVIKAERNDEDSPKWMAAIVVKRMKQHYEVAFEQHIGWDGTKFCVRSTLPKEMLLQNQREATASTEIASELNERRLGSEKLAWKHGLVLNEGGMWAAHLRRGQSFCCVHLCNIGSDNTACLRVVTRRMEVRAKAPSNVKGRNALLGCRYAL